METVLTDVSDADGSVFIPVFRMDMGQTNEAAEKGTSELMAEAKRFVARWQKCLPSATFAEPLLLPDLNAKMGALAIDEIGEKLRSHLATQLQHYPHTAARMAQRVDDAQMRAESCLRDLIREPLNHISLSYDAWEMERQKMSRFVIEEWISSAGDMDTYIRWQIRKRLLESLGYFSFPVRTVWSAIALTNGVWDRVFLAMQGSLLSLLFAAHKTSSNVKTWLKTRRSEQRNATTALEAKLINRMTPTANQFSRDLTGLLSQRSGSTVTLQEPQIKITGFDNLRVYWQQLLAKELKQVEFTLSRWVIGPACLVFFWFLVLGQLFVLYGQHLPFATKSWSLKFPQPDAQLLMLPAGLWTTTLLLALVPAVVSGIFLNAWTARKHQVEKVCTLVGQQLGEDQQAGKLMFTVDWINPHYQAAQRLIRLVRK